MNCLNYNDPKIKAITEALGGDPVKTTQYYHNYNGDIDLLYDDVVVKKGNLSKAYGVKPGVAELFDSNPELANQVYEALGFRQKLYSSKLKEISERRKLATKWDLENSQLIKDIRVDKSQPKELKPNKADLDLTAIMLFGKRYDEIVDIYRGRFDAYGEPLDDIPDGKLEAKTLAYRILNDLLFNRDEINEYILEIVENPEYAAALTTNENPVKEFFENDIFKQVEKSKLEITQQQKQQALQLYSQYLETKDTPIGSKENIEGFKEFISKPKPEFYTPVEPPSGEGYEVIQGTVGADKKRLIDILGQRMYVNNLSDVVMKEVIQNSFDATKIAVDKGLIKKGKIDITVNHIDNTVTFKDNGIGMTPEIVQKAFFTIGGTYKGENVDNKLKSGGLGLAKMAFMFGSEWLDLKTVHNGVKTTVKALSEDIRNEKFEIIKQSTNEPNGTTLTVKIPQTRLDSNGDVKSVGFYYTTNSAYTEGFLGRPLLGDVEFTYEKITKDYNGQPKIDKKTLDLGKVPEGYMLLTKATTSWGDMDIYVDTQNDFLDDDGSHSHHILSSGLYQFTKNFKKTGQYNSLPFNIIIDIKPKVTAENELYPISNNRESFNKNVTDDIAALSYYLNQFYSKVNLDVLRKSFGRMGNIDKVDLDRVNAEAIRNNQALIESTSLKDPEELKRIIQSRVKEFSSQNETAEIQKGDIKTNSFEITKKEIEEETRKTEEKRWQSTFKAEKEINVDKVKQDTGLDPAKPFIHNNTNMKLDEKASKFISEISTLMHEYRDSYVKTYGAETGTIPDINNQLWGVSIDKGYLGVNVSSRIMGMGILAINPFSVLPGANLKIENVTYIATALEHLISHEFNHNWAREEGAGFTSRFIHTEAELASLPNHFELFQKLRKIVSDNIETLIRLKLEYEKATNLEKSFEQNKLTAYRPNTERTGDGMEALPGYTGEDVQRRESEELRSESNISIGEILKGLGFEKITKKKQFQDAIGLSGKAVSKVDMDNALKRMKTVNLQMNTGYFPVFRKLGDSDMYAYHIEDSFDVNVKSSETQVPAEELEARSPQEYKAAPVNDVTYDDPESLMGLATRLNSDATQTLTEVQSMNSVANERVKRIADRLSGMFGNIPYEFVTIEDAATIIARSGQPYNNEPAFYYGNTVYFVKDRVNDDMAFHEFAHPFVAAIRTYNRKLYDKLVADLGKTPEGQMLNNILLERRKDLDPGSDRFNDEMIVMAISSRMKYENMGIEPSTGFIGWLKDLFYQIKKMLRELFGKKINISKLDQGTTLNQLVVMLEKGEMFDIKNDQVTEQDVAEYYTNTKDMVEDMTRVPKNDQTILFNRVYSIVSKHIKQLKDDKNFTGLLEVLKDRYDQTEFEEIQKNIGRFTEKIGEDAKNFLSEAQTTTARASAMIDTIHKLNVVMKKFNEHMDDLLLDKDSKENAYRAFYYRNFVDHYSQFVKEFMDVMQDTVAADSPLRAIVNSLDNQIKDIVRKSQKFSSYAASTFIYEQLGIMGEQVDRKYETIIQEVTEKAKRRGEDPKRYRDYWFKEWKGMTEDELKEYEDLKAAKARLGNLSGELENRLIKLQNQLFDGVQITKEKLDLAIAGIGPDASPFSSFLEGYLYNPDVVVGGFALYIKNNMTEVMVKAQAKMNDFFIEVYKDVEAAGYKPNAVEEFAEKIIRLQEIGRTNENGDYEVRKVWSMLGEFKDYRIARDNLNNAISAAEKNFTLKGDKESEVELTKARKALEDLEQKFFHNMHHPIFYERYKMFDNENPLDIEAWKRYKQAQEELDNFDRSVYSEDIFMDTKDIRNMLWRNYKQLFSRYDKDGKLKQGDELLITEKLIKFRKETAKFYEWVPNFGSFTKSLHKYQQSLIDQGIPKTDPRHAEKVKEWIEANTIPKIKQEWFNDRAILINKLKELYAKINPDISKDIDVSTLYEELNNIAYPYRDINNQIDGTDMSDRERSTVKNIEEAIIKMQERLKKMNGLTEEETFDREQLHLKQVTHIQGKGEPLTAEERNRYTNYIRKSAASVYKFKNEIAEIRQIQEALAQMTSKEVTQAYCDELNDLIENDTNLSLILVEKDLPLQYTPSNIGALMGDFREYNLTIDKMRKDSDDFDNWYRKNHVTRRKWNGSAMAPYNEPLYIWRLTVPSEDEYFESYEVEEIDGQKYTIPRSPSLRFWKHQPKEFYEEFDAEGNLKTRVKLKTDRIVGITIDNQERWLPRNDVPDSPFIDERYTQLKNSTNPDDQRVFKALEKLKETHLKNQEGLGNRSKLYLDLPRYRKDNLETIRTRNRVKQATKMAKGQTPDDEENKKGGFLQLIIDRVREFFRGSGASSELDGTGAQLNFNDQMLLVRTDMFDNEISKVPIGGLANIDHNDVSLDIPKSIMRYMLSAERHKKLVEINPAALMIKEAVQMNSPKDSNRYSMWHMTNGGILKRITGKQGGDRQRAERDISVREKAITNLYEREFLGQYNTGMFSDSSPMSATMQNLSNFLFKGASLGFFALNIGSALKNMFGPKIQGLIMSAGGEYMTPKSYAQGEKWSFNTMFELSFGLYKAEPASVNVQLLEIMDIIPDRLQNKFGERISRTLSRDAASFTWLYNFRKWTESQSTAALGGAMMAKQMVDTTDGSKMSFKDAWQVVGGRIQLKPNVDPSWGITYDQDGNMKVGDKFKYFRNRVQQAGTLLQGSYGQFEQPEAQRYLAWRFISYLRRYFTSMFINRWGFRGSWRNPMPRLNYGLGDVHMGYYVSTLRTLKRAFEDRGKYFAYMSPQEKADMMKFFAEIAILVLLTALLGPLFGWDPDDDEKYEKLKEKSGPLPLPGVTEDPRYPFQLGGWLENHAMLLMMQVRSENEQFVMFPNFGMDDYLQMLNLKSVAVDPTLGTLGDIITSMYNAALGNDAAYYERAIGPYDWQQEERWKLWNYIAKYGTLTGSQVEPVKGIKDLISVKTRN